MQNQILHIAQPKREPAQTYRRILLQKNSNLVLTSLTFFYRYFRIFSGMVWVMENPPWSFDRAGRVLLGTLIGTLGTPTWTNMSGFY